VSTAGFDIYPPLERTKANQEEYELFLREVLDTYGPRDGDGAEQGDGGSVVRVNAESEDSLSRIFEECTRLRSSG
jgi:hypothetical protein